MHRPRSPSLLSPSVALVKPTTKTRKESCFEHFRSTLQRYMVHPKTTERERLSGSQWRGHDFVRLAELTQWLETTTSGRHSSPLEDLLRDVFAEEDIALSLGNVLKGDTRCLVTFCILLEIERPDLLAPFQEAQLHDRHLPMNLDILDRKVREALKDAGKDDFEMAQRIAVEFNERQWKYHPTKLSTVRQRLEAARVLPFVDRQLITDKGGTSSVYQVAVPERFVDGDMKAKVTASMEPHPDFPELGNCCHFALKVFKAENIKIFKAEVEMYKMMTDTGNNSMLTYLGNFTSLDTGNDTTHTIILEYADGDLSEYFYRTSPVLPDQILRFWRGFASIPTALRNLHEFKICRYNDEIDYEAYHSDLKSANILIVNGQFKLADPGFAQFQRRREEPGSPRKSHSFTGGTTTYGAPERHSFAHEVKNPQASDMWSLGCVLSESVTWIVLGFPGIRQYRDLRLNAVRGQCTRERGSPPLASKRSVRYDNFHNGERVLLEVEEWHKLLRQVRRPTDVFTDKILDLVDQCLLVKNPEDRFEAVDVCKWFEEHLSEAELKINDFNCGSEVVRNAISEALKNEAEELQGHLDSRSKVSREAAKEDPTYLQVPGLTTPSKFILSSQAVLTETISRSHLPGQGHQGNTPDSTARKAESIERSTIPVATIHAQTDRSMLQRRNGRKYDIFHSHYTSIDKSLGDDQDQGDVKASGIWNRIRPGSKTKDKKLANYIQDRDLVFLMDNGATMTQHWYEAVFVLETLYNKCRGSDDDGVDLYFTCGKTSDNVTKAKDDLGIKAFRSKVWHAAVRPNSEKVTDMARALKSRLNVWIEEYEERRQELTKDQRQRKHKKPLKDLTVIVLTDGMWPLHRGHPTAVDDVIVSFNERFRKAAQESMNPRTVSIQFVSFGNDPAALERFRRLDDNLGQRGVHDIVDHEPASGDVYKMLAGSVEKDLDELNGAEAENSAKPASQIEIASMNLLPAQPLLSRAPGRNNLPSFTKQTYR